MVLSFTENFQRVGFSPVEEARFFYKALEIKDFLNIKNFHEHSEKVIQLAKDLPASSFTISRRLYLLTLPEKVQGMIFPPNIIIRHYNKKRRGVFLLWLISNH